MDRCLHPVKWKAVFRFVFLKTACPQAADMRQRPTMAARGRASSSLMYARRYAVAAVSLDARRAAAESAEQRNRRDERK
jgi:hypothetical protein